MAGYRSLLAFWIGGAGNKVYAYRNFKYPLGISVQAHATTVTVQAHATMVRT